MMDGTDLLRAELVRAAQSLGAPDDVEPVIERPRDPSFGDWATNLAMMLAKPLGKKPRDLAQRRSSSGSILRARASARRKSPGPGSSISASRATCSPRDSRALIAAGRAVRSLERRAKTAR